MTTHTWATISARIRTDGDRPRVASSARSAAFSNMLAARSTIAHSTASFEVTCAYRLAPWMSSARAMSRTPVAA